MTRTPWPSSTPCATPSTAAGIPVMRRIMTHDVTVEGNGLTPTAVSSAPPTPTPIPCSPPNASAPATESAPAAATSKPNSPPSRPPRRSPSATTANSSSPPPKRSPKPSTGTHQKPHPATRAGILITGHVALRDAMIGLPIRPPPSRRRPMDPHRSPAAQPAPRPSAHHRRRLLTACSATAYAPASPSRPQSTKPKPPTLRRRARRTAARCAARRHTARRRSPTSSPQRTQTPPRLEPYHPAGHIPGPASPRTTAGLAGPPFSSGRRGGAPRASADGHPPVAEIRSPSPFSAVSGCQV